MYFRNVLHICDLFTAGYFLTKIFHPNVAKNGEICVNTLKKDWKEDLGFRHILLVRSSSPLPPPTHTPPIPPFRQGVRAGWLRTQTIKCLLIVPNPESALNEEAGRLLLEDYEECAPSKK
jgi:ubiquitin-conjugating enzyme E2 S